MTRPLRNLATPAVALVMLATSCSAFRAQSDVDVKAVPVNLLFGAKVPKASSPPPAPTLQTPPRKPIDLGPVESPPAKEPKPREPLCGPTTAIAPKEAAVGNIKRSHDDTDPPQKGNEPRTGAYLFGFVQNIEGEQEVAGITFQSISDFGPDGTDGFHYSIRDEQTGMKLWFQAVELTETSAPGTAGLFLQEIDWPTKDTGARASQFKPAHTIPLMSFPVTPGVETISSSPESAPKRGTGVTDPSTRQEILAPSANVMQSDFTVGTVETIEVCTELAQAYKVTWDLKITGEFNTEMVGTFWLATQWGGWPIRQDYVLSGDLLAGNFAATLMRLDPTTFI